jgi:serine/threonine protein kinase
VQHSNVHITGAHIGFAGAIWTDRPHLQVLAPILPLFYHASDDDMRMQTARCLGATKKAILSLQNYYQFKLPSLAALLPAQLTNLAFPHPIQYLSLDDGTIRTFKYSSQLYEDKLVFCGTVGNDKICIKFVRRYSKEAHLKCSSLGFAPALRGFDLIPGGWYMVVMDFIDDMYHNLEDSLTTASFKTKAEFKTEAREKLASLHQGGVAHGDVRPTNIMVKRDGSSGIMLVDFDWAGEIGKVRYPMNVNNVDIKRPHGVHDNELILAQHDMVMIDYMFE